jgi:very-short-patch-repair endonuclease
MQKEILTYINGVPIYKNFIKTLPYNPDLKQRARNLRKLGNYPEVVFWQQVHKGLFHTLDFDRQRIIGNYIADFYVKPLGLIVEIDGTSHNDKEEYDERRDKYFEAHGLIIFRTSTIKILHDLDNVMRELERFIIKNFG